MFVSIKTAGWLNANAHTAAAVYGPTPGNVSNTEASLGIIPLYSRTIISPARLRYNALLLYPKPLHKRITEASGACANNSTVGNFLTNVRKNGTTRSACVCQKISYR